MELHRGPADRSRETIPDAIAGAVVGRAPDERMLALDVPKVGKVMRQPFVVGVKKREPFGVGGGDGRVPRRGGAPVLAMADDASPERGGHLSGVVSGVVIDDDHLFGSTWVLGPHTGQAPRKLVSAVVSGYDHADGQSRAFFLGARRSSASAPRRSQTPLKLSRSPNGKLGYRSGPCHTIARPPPSPGWRG